MIEGLLLLLLGIVITLAIIAANGYFVAQEFAYMSVDRNRLGVRAAAGDPAAVRALAVTKRTSFMLSGAQLGITVTGLLVGFVAEPLIGEAIGSLLGGVGIPMAVSVTAGTVLALVLATVVQMIFGELYPKNLAIANPEPLARGLARSTTIYLALFGWLISVFDLAANALLRVLRIEPVHDVDSSATAQDLERIVSDSRDSGDLPAELSLMLDRILEFPQQDVEHAMIPRSLVATIRPDTTVGEVRELMAHAHTRYPVVDDESQPLGVVQLADVLGSPLAEDAPVTELMQPAVVLSTLMKLPDALAELTRTHNELACAIDEYGGFAGVLTLEDLAEEIVGEITDEHDDAAPTVQPDGDAVWTMSGDVHVDEMHRAIGYELPTGDFETVAGLVIAEHGGLPAAGDTVRVALPDDPADLVRNDEVHRSLEVEVLGIERHVPSEVRVTLVETSGTDEVPDDGPETDVDGTREVDR
ncbi:hemolysin family protein [Planctomonas psychrotolerans]|uniref:hemolysin family protein n=1 Tax=Planctomonas psychrotolerans TaxID=2528712 RepID=UPI00123B31E7|nr:hemolysin family protein [Planctomonas psychrotolerans]